ncbi:hypothetical protein VPH35_074418 [Triticum aestivum]
MAFAFEIFVILNYAYGSHLIRCTHICSVYQLVQVAVCRLFLSAPPLVDLACWSLPCLPLACPLPSSGGLCGLFYIGIHINYEKIATMPSLSVTASPNVLVCWLTLCLPPPLLEGLCRPPLMPLLYSDQ